MSITQGRLIHEALEDLGKIHLYLTKEFAAIEDSERVIGYLEELEDKLTEFAYSRLYSPQEGRLLLAFLTDIGWIHFGLYHLSTNTDIKKFVLNPLEALEEKLWSYYEHHLAYNEVLASEKALEEAIKRLETAKKHLEEPNRLSIGERQYIGGNVKGSLQTAGIWDPQISERFHGWALEWATAKAEEPTVLSPSLPERQWRKPRPAIQAREERLKRL